VRGTCASRRRRETRDASPWHGFRQRSPPARALSGPEFGHTFSSLALSRDLCNIDSPAVVKKIDAGGSRTRIHREREGERPCIIVHSPMGRRAIYVRACTRVCVCTYGTNVLAHKSNFCISVVDITVPDPFADTLIGGRRVLRTGNIWWPTMGVRFPFFSFLPLSFFFWFVAYSKFMP